MGSCIISGKAKKSIEDALKSASFVALGSDGNYNFGGTSLSWTASKNSLVFCNWEGLSSNYTGSISFTGGGYQIGSRLYQSPDYLPKHWAAVAYLPKGAKISMGGSSTSDEHFSMAMWGIYLE